jgi:hypothetical protein
LNLGLFGLLLLVIIFIPIRWPTLFIYRIYVFSLIRFILKHFAHPKTGLLKVWHNHVHKNESVPILSLKVGIRLSWFSTSSFAFFHLISYARKILGTESLPFDEWATIYFILGRTYFMFWIILSILLTHSTLKILKWINNKRYTLYFIRSLTLWATIRILYLMCLVPIAMFFAVCWDHSTGAGLVAISLIGILLRQFIPRIEIPLYTSKFLLLNSYYDI